MDEYLHSYNFKVALWLRSQCGFMVSGYMFYWDGYRKLEMSDGGGQYLQPCGATRFTTKLIKLTQHLVKIVHCLRNVYRRRWGMTPGVFHLPIAIVIVHGKLCMLRVCKRLQIIFDFLWSLRSFLFLADRVFIPKLEEREMDHNLTESSVPWKAYRLIKRIKRAILIVHKRWDCCT